MRAVSWFLACVRIIICSFLTGHLFTLSETVHISRLLARSKTLICAFLAFGHHVGPSDATMATVNDLVRILWSPKMLCRGSWLSTRRSKRLALCFLSQSPWC